MLGKLNFIKTTFNLTKNELKLILNIKSFKQIDKNNFKLFKLYCLAKNWSELGSTKFDAAFRGKEVVDKEGKKAEYYDDIYLCDYQGFKFTATTDDELKKIITESGLKLIDVKTASFKANQKLMILTVER